MYWKVWLKKKKRDSFSNIYARGDVKKQRVNKTTPKAQKGGGEPIQAKGRRHERAVSGQLKVKYLYNLPQNEPLKPDLKVVI